MKTHVPFSVLVFGLVSTLCAHPLKAATFSLEEATIVRNDSAGRILISAADELALHLRLIGGKTIATGTTQGPGLTFYFIPPPNAPKAGPYEAHYRIEGDRVWFWGDESKGFPGNYKGSVFAVYGFLKNELGVKWVAPGDRGIVCGRSATLTLPDSKEDVFVPPFRQSIFRTLTGKTMMAPSMPILWDFVDYDPVPKALRMSLSEANSRSSAASQWLERQRLHSPDMISYGHAFTGWQERFGTTHPEYLALDEKGNRGSPDYPTTIKLCVSNTNVHNQIIADWVASGMPRYLNICENDGGGFCRCDDCCALDADLPGESFLETKTDRYLWFDNRIAELATKFRPDVQVVSYIYSYYRHPPRREVVEYPDNMVFGAVPSLADDMRAFYEGWQKVGMRQFFLRPNFHTTWGTLPCGNEKRIYDAFQVGVEFGLVGSDFDAHLWRDMIGPESYVTARMLQSPTEAFENIMTEYYSAYGAAANVARTYFERIRSRQAAGFEESKAAAERDNPLDDSGYSSYQLSIHSEAALQEDIAILESGRSLDLDETSRLRLEEQIVRARHYLLAYRFFEAARHTDLDRLRAAGVALLDYRKAHRAVLMDVYEQSMNSRYAGTEGAVWKRIQDVLRAAGGMTERTDGAAITASTVAFYPFNDKASGYEADGRTIANAVDSSKYPGTCTRSSVNGSEMKFSDVRPGRYIFSRCAYEAECLTSGAGSIHATVSGNWDVSGGGTIDFAGLATAIGGLSEWTVEFMYLLDQAHSSYSGYLTIPVQINSNAQNVVAVKTNDGQWRCHFDTALSWGIVNYPSTLRDDKWHHLALIYSGGKLKLVCDRTKSASIDCSGISSAPNAALSLMGNYLHGYVTGLRVSSKALSASEFIFASDDPKCLPREVFHWSMEGAIGDSVTSLVNRAAASLAGWRQNVERQYFPQGLDWLGAPGEVVTESGAPQPVYVSTTPGGSAAPYVRVSDDVWRQVMSCGSVSVPAASADKNILVSRLRSKPGSVYWMADGSFTHEAFLRFDRAGFDAAYSASGLSRREVGVLGAYGGNGGRPWYRLCITDFVGQGGKEKLQLLAAKQDWTINEYASVTVSPEILSDGNWHHVCVQYSAVKHRLSAYVDYNTKLAEVELSLPLMTPDDSQLLFTAGSCYGIGCGPFVVDEVRLSRGLLTPPEMVRFEETQKGSIQWVR